MLKILFVETRQCDHKNKHTLTRLMEIENVLLFFETCQCVLWHVALTRLYGNDSFFTRCVRDWSGILCERSWELGFGNGDLGLGNNTWERGEMKRAKI